MLLETFHNASVLIMTGVIWLIQLLVYPTFQNVDPAHWMRVHGRHTRMMGLIAFPLMVIELASSGVLYFATQQTPYLIYFIAASVMWLTTMLVFVPLHNRIARRPLRGDLEKLVQLNWFRTGVWTMLTIMILAKPAASSKTQWLPDPEPQSPSSSSAELEY